MIARNRMIVSFLLGRGVHRNVAERAAESLQPLIRIADSGRIQLIAADRLNRAKAAEVIGLALGRPVTDAVPYCLSGDDLQEVIARHRKLAPYFGRLFVESFRIPNDAELDYVMSGALLDDVEKAVMNTLFPPHFVEGFAAICASVSLILDHVAIAFVDAVARNEVQQMTRITNLLPLLPRAVPLCDLVQDRTRMLVLTGPKTS